MSRKEPLFPLRQRPAEGRPLRAGLNPGIRHSPLRFLLFFHGFFRMRAPRSQLQPKRHFDRMHRMNRIRKGKGHISFVRGTP
jgi:hypothetical protein